MRARNKSRLIISNRLATAPLPLPPSSFPSNPFENSLEIRPPLFPPPYPKNEQKQWKRRGRGTSSRGFHARPMPRVQRALISDVIVSPSGQSTHVFQDKRADQSLPSFLRASIANLLCRQFLFSQRDESMVYHVVYIYIGTLCFHQGDRLRYLVATTPIADDTDIDRID